MRTNNNRSRFDNSKKYVINDRIFAEEMRLVDETGEQVGIVSKAEAIKIAEERSADLVLITAQAKPPVVKVIDFHKFLYQEEKKNKESRKGQKKSSTKDVQLSLFIGEQDLERFKNKSIEFLEDGYQVRVKLVLRGRELGKKDMAFALINRFLASLGDIIVSSEPKMQGKIIIAVIARKKV